MSANRALMERYWAAAEANDLDTMHGLRDEGFVVDFPQTGERLTGRDAVRAYEVAHGDGSSSFELVRLTGEGGAWVAEGLMRSASGTTHVVSISELQHSRVVRSIDYFAGPLPPMLSSGEPDAPSGR